MTIGRDCYVGPLVTVTHALVGDRVILHAGCAHRPGRLRLRHGRARAPQGAADRPRDHPGRRRDRRQYDSSTAARLRIRSSAKGTKIDNLVQIGHNVVVGRHCVIVAKSAFRARPSSAISSSWAAKSGAVGHIRIGAGAQIAGAAHRPRTTSRREHVSVGTPARPMRNGRASWAYSRGLAKRSREGGGGPGEDDDGA